MLGKVVISLLTDSKTLIRSDSRVIMKNTVTNTGQFVSINGYQRVEGSLTVYVIFYQKYMSK